MSANTTRRRVAAKPRCCPSCDRIIPLGAVYLEHKSFPGSDDGWGDAAGHPVRMAECADPGRHEAPEPLPQPTEETR